MPPLHAPATPTTASHVDVEPAHDRPDGREIFLILRDHVRVVDARAAVRTGRGHRHILHGIDDGGRQALALTTIRRTGLSAGPARRSMRGALRERRGLPIAGPPSGLQLIAQPLVFSAESIALSLSAFEIAPQPLVVVQHLLECRPVTPRRSLSVIAHAPVMPESARQYKSDPVTNYEWSILP